MKTTWFHNVYICIDASGTSYINRYHKSIKLAILKSVRMNDKPHPVHVVGIEVLWRYLYRWFSVGLFCVVHTEMALCGLEDASIWEVGGVFIQSSGMFRWSAICLPCLEHAVTGNMHPSNHKCTRDWDSIGLLPSVCKIFRSYESIRQNNNKKSLTNKKIPRHAGWIISADTFNEHPGKVGLFQP